MSHPQSMFQEPPAPRNGKNETRQVGVEMEYGGVSIPQAAELIQARFGGERISHNRFYQEIKGSQIGDFTLELDSQLLTHKQYEQPLAKLGISLEDLSLGNQRLDQWLENLLDEAAQLVVPFEIVAPPLPWDELSSLEELINDLRETGARGTGESLAYAFGLHLNPEVPSQQAESLHRHLQSFVLLYPLLLDIGNIDLSRRLSPFIDPFPHSYVHLLLYEGYAPDGPQLVRDYHHHNPDRNRPLDMYPILAHVWPETVQTLEGIGKLSPRPTFHYRLPNCEIDRKGWTLAQEWNRWLAIERLAADKELLTELTIAYFRLEAENSTNFNGSWKTYLKENPNLNLQ